MIRGIVLLLFKYFLKHKYNSSINLQKSKYSISTTKK